jgi:hypothetical protein
VGGIDEQVIRQRQQALGDRAVQRPRHLLGRLLAMGVQIGSSGVPDEQRVARQHHPRLLTAPVVGDQECMVSRGVARRRHRLDHRVAEPHELAVGERVVIEVDARALGHVAGGARALDQLRKPRDVIGLDVGLEHRRDPGALSLGAGDVLVNQVRMRIDHGELAHGLTPKQIGGAGRLVGEDLAEEHRARR